ncbi:MAG: ComF family protein [Candidatus Doudnabacteria bacterium Gr01-1014_77]|uniref:ComF family protein n=1 Tax=Candidatus Doudnabacteria bacterium Gr01-1014_77 TaxID=2017133 RepID=A0A554JAS2_9BACT|nr:MAG: ComF family protein [Candidatus Doudnabacteria bacterium Gr01-1014_77]
MRQDFKLNTKTLNEQLLEMLFPTHCVGCREYGMLLCKNCWDNIDFLDDKYEEIISICSTKQPLIRKMLNALNCDLIKGLNTTAAELIFKFLLERQALPDESFVISYVPIHQRKQSIQGFNQSETIAQELGRLIGMPVLTLLKKTKENPSEYIAWNCKGSKILLIDTCLTKDTQIKDCAHILKQAGATQVSCLTFARDF